MKISDSTVLLTGATGGIGHAIARALHARGAKLILTGRRGDVLEPLAAELGGRALAVDLSNRDDVKRLIDQSREAEILIANAALPGSGPLDSYDEEQMDRVLEVNLRAPIAITHAMLPAMIDRGRGHLLFISSLSGKAATAGASLYSASKYGLRGFATALREDLRESGIGVSAVFPGFIRDAGMFADTEVKLPPGVGTRTPQDVARAVVKAIEQNRGEVDVAPLSLRVGSAFAGLAPEISATVARKMGSHDLALRVDSVQRQKR